MDDDFNKDMEYDSYFDEYAMVELKQDNDKWEEKNNEYLRKITKG